MKDDDKGRFVLIADLEPEDKWAKVSFGDGWTGIVRSYCYFYGKAGVAGWFVRRKDGERLILKLDCPDDDAPPKSPTELPSVRRSNPVRRRILL